MWFVVFESWNYVFQLRSSWVSVSGDLVEPSIRTKRSPQVADDALIHPRQRKLWF